MPGIFGDDFLSLLSPLATAQYRPTPSATFPNPPAPAPGPLSIPPAQPPIFLSPPDPAGAAPAQPASALGGIGHHHHAATGRHHRGDARDGDGEDALNAEYGRAPISLPPCPLPPAHW